MNNDDGIILQMQGDGVWGIKEEPYYTIELATEDYERLQKALEKQIPKKPQEADVDFSTFVCPNCLSTIMHTDEKETHNYCLKCGQKLDWRVEE